MATIKQKKVFKDVMENKGKPISKAMIDNGYPKTTAKNPQQLTNSLGWKELMDKYWKDELITKTVKEAMKAKKTEVIGGKVVESKDYAIRLKASEIALKAKGRYVEQATQVNLEGIKVQVMPRQWDTINSTDME
jgi:hypothetical protein